MVYVLNVGIAMSCLPPIKLMVNIVCTTRKNGEKFGGGCQLWHCYTNITVLSIEDP